MIKLNSFFRHILIFLALLVISFPTIRNILRPGYFPMHDDIQAMRVLEMDKCFSDGQIPCRWVPDMGYGYGYPQFNFYGPLPYYMMEGFHKIGLGYLDSVKAGLVVITLVGLIGIFILGESIWGVGGGFICAILYAFAPYRALDFYVRGDVGELAALAIFPYLFWSVREILLGYKKSILWFALSVGALLSTHNISTLIFTPVLALWALFIILTNKKEILPKIKTRLLYLAVGGMWGIFLGAFFLLPAWFEKSYVHVETLLLGYFNYLAHFVSINQLLFSTYWNYGSSEAGIYDELFLGIGLIYWIIPLFSLLLLFLLKKKKEFKIVLFLTAVGWLSLFLTHEKSTFIWSHLPILAYIQFPWRFIILATFLFSVAGGALTKIFVKNILILIVAIFLFCLFFYSSYFRPSKWLYITDAYKFSGDSWTLQQTISIFDYLPIFAKAPPAREAPSTPVFVQGTGENLGGVKKSDSGRWDIKITSQTAEINLPIFYFPGWKLYVDSVPTVINYKNDLGLIGVTVPSGVHKVEAIFTNTPVRTVSDIMTVLGLLFIPIGAYFIWRK